MISVARWIDIDGEEYKLLSAPAAGRRMIERAIACKAITADKEGKLFFRQTDGLLAPINDNLNGEVVGIRYSKLAAN